MNALIQLKKATPLCIILLGTLLALSSHRERKR